MDVSSDGASFIAIRDPRSAYPAVERLVLAARPAQPASARYCLIQTMPPGSGLEAPIEAVAAELARRFPEAEVERFMRRDFMIDDPEERAAIVARSDAAIIFLGPAATMIHVGWVLGAALEREGLPVAAAVFEGFEGVAEHTARVRASDLRHAFVAAAVPETALASAASEIVDALLAPLRVEETAGGQAIPETPERIAARGSPDELQQLMRTRGWTDGLPVRLPTEAAVEAMLQGTSRPAEDIVTPTLRPEGLETTVEMVAINAVMAGCEPAHLPLVLAAVSLYGGIELESMTRSVNSFAFSHLVGGTIAKELGVVGGLNAIGPGNYPNAAIARAIGLTLRNCGGLRVGSTATPTLGNAAGITIFAENEAESPWPPFHVDEGHAAGEDLVSLFVGGMSVMGSFYYRGLPEAARLMTQVDSTTGALLLLSAKRARALAKEGLDRGAVADALWRDATVSLGAFRANGFFPLTKALIQRAAAAGRPPPWPAHYLTGPDEEVVPLYPRGSIKVAVVGAAVSSVMQLWSSTLQATAPVSPWR